MTTDNNTFKNLSRITFVTLSLAIMFIFMLIPLITNASDGTPPTISGIRLEFILFGLTLTGVALFHKYTFWVSLTGLIVILLYKFTFDHSFPFIEHFIGTHSFTDQFIHKEMREGEWGIIVNLFGLLLGFAILAKLFENSKIPDILPKYLPDGKTAPAVLLIFIFIMSALIDNIAATLIGGAIALTVFNKRIHIGYLVAIVATANAGGAGSVLGDTTTTMMWIDGVKIMDLVHAFIAASVALIIIAWFSSFQQNKMQPIQKDPKPGIKIGKRQLLIVIMMLVGAIATNIIYDMPALGVWLALGIGALFTKIPWKEIKSSISGTIFLICLVTAASLMPVETLPDAHWSTAFVLGFISSIFDNIPLTKLCLDQGHYDWGILAYTVGFGGSMIWFGSSAGVAISNKFPEAKDIVKWIRKGWYVLPAYIIGFFVMLIIWGWFPTSNKKHTEPPEKCKVENCQIAKEARESFINQE